MKHLLYILAFVVLDIAPLPVGCSCNRNDVDETWMEDVQQPETQQADNATPQPRPAE